MVQLAPDASPLSRRLQPKKKKMHTLVLLAWPGHLCILTLVRREAVFLKTDETGSFFVFRSHIKLTTYHLTVNKHNCICTFSAVRMVEWPYKHIIIIITHCD